MNRDFQCESRSDEVIAAAFTRVSVGGNFIGLLSPDWRNDKMFIVRLFRNSRRVIALKCRNSHDKHVEKGYSKKTQ